MTGRGVLAGFLATAVACLAVPAPAGAATTTFPYNGPVSGGAGTGTAGSTQTWTVPAGVTLATFDLYGAAGAPGAGDSFSPSSPGGLGAHLRATIPVVPGQLLLVRVGGSPPRGTATGGFNGGGGEPSNGNVFFISGGGGGASDVRSGASLGERLLVAGGGGGAAGNGVGPGGAGNDGAAGGAGGSSGSPGAAGSPDAGAGSTPGQPGGAGTTPGGTPGAGGTGSPAGSSTSGSAGGSGSLGQGGPPGFGPIAEGGNGGGGGGGYFGGGGGGGGGSDDNSGLGSGGGGGGGGTSFASQAATSMVLEDGVNTSHGRVVVNYVADPKITSSPKYRKRGSAKKGRRPEKRYVFRFEEAPGTRALCRMDQGSFSPCGSPAIYKGLKPGTHIFAVKSVAADGTESAPQTKTFRVRPLVAR